MASKERRGKTGAHRPAGGPRGRKAGSPKGHSPRGYHKPATPAGRPKYVLSNLQPPVGSRHKKVRVGRGIGSKLGKTSGAGNKGQKSRRGYSRRRGFEGGQMPLHRRMPKRGFHNPFSVTYSVVNLEELNVFPAGETVTPDLLRAHGFIRRAKDRIKVLGDGQLTAKIAIHAHAFSASAKEKIAAAGGSFEVLA
jgi:large subunit ribosomal protein L15